MPGNQLQWIEELDAAIERLKKRVDKIVAGGGYDPERYLYNTPFLDYAAHDTTLIVNHEGDYVYTATGPQAVVLEVVTRSDTCYVMLQDTDSITANAIKVKIVRTNDPPSVVCGPYYLEAGQVLKVQTEGTLTGSALTVIPVKTSQLQETETLIQRTKRTIKKMLGGE